MYNEVNVMRHQEERTCLNCGKVWTIWIRKDNTSGRTWCFCDKCNKILTPEDKKRIRMEKDEIYKQKVHEQKRMSHRRHIVHYMWLRAKQRAEKYGYEFNIEESDIVIP